MNAAQQVSIVRACFTINKKVFMQTLTVKMEYLGLS
jgi:hypothetical protein